MMPHASVPVHETLPVTVMLRDGGGVIEYPWDVRMFSILLKY